MEYKDLFKIDATLVANEFLDKYMPSANGDYVKVYLYLLRNKINGINIETIADELELTEGDVRRAIKYWEKIGIVSVGKSDSEAKDKVSGAETVNDNDKEAKTEKQTEENDNEELRNHYRKTEGKEALDRLSKDKEFEDLLIIVQKYRSKILTENEQQVLAYLYDGLHMSCDLLDYLVAYCVENGHTEMRYIEKVGLNWTTEGITDVKAAKKKTKEFGKLQENTAKKKTAKVDKQGITRDTDYDIKLLEQTMNRMMN